MRAQNLTPFLFGYKVTSRRPPQPEMTLVVRGAFVLAPHAELAVPEGIFPLSQGSLSAETFAEEDEERAKECLYPGDFADYKPHAEVLLRGACHPPGGRPARSCRVRFAVGAWSKSLVVHGPRVWTTSARGEAPTEPAPFTRMPLTYENAFGGAGHLENPMGKGLGAFELPSVEHPDAPLRTRRDRPAPASFAPINPAWSPRAGKVGKQYGAAWRKQRAPYYAEDFDWTYFNAAPADQQLDRYLRGDEIIAFENLHPEAPRFEKRLPGVRIRAFVDDVHGRVREVPLHLDTLFADLGAERLFLTWRGVDAVEENDLADVRAVLLAEEPLAGPAREAAEYHAMLADFERDPRDLERAVPESLRAPWRLMQERANGKAPAGNDDASDPISALLGHELGDVEKPQQARVGAAVARAGTVPLPEGRDLRALLSGAVNDRSTATTTPAKPGAPLTAVLQRIVANVEVLKAQAAKGVPVPGLDRLEAMLADPRLRQLAPGFRMPGEAAPAEPGPGVDLRGRDLGGRDLRGADLTGADLTGAHLAGANLSGACLAGALLVDAILSEANLEDANLERANLTGASLGRARATGVILRGATIDKLDAGRAVLRCAVLAEVRGEAASFAGADLTGSDGRGAELVQAIFDECSLEDAQWSGARLDRCRIENARAARILLEGAHLGGTSFSNTDLTGARLVEIRAPRSIWLRANLTRADLRWASLPEAHLSEANAREALFRCADLADARLYRTALTGAALDHTNLLRADLCKADLTRALCTGANLYDAKLLGALLKGCDFTGANTLRSTLEAS
ncbi:pentapeptide repeat family protein [Minicystis rosea]|nr:pentapeptide repeat family protein [Minicystis rosea]